MKYMGVNELREKFLKFWETKDHLRHASYSLIPENDKSLLLIAAGMAPLKPYFSGAQVPPRKRMTTAQKCIRTNDIDNVGHTARHATFFEMMGNFSFGDYFKEGAINWGWEFITSPEWLDIPKEKVWATIYEDDDEAFNIWKDQVGMPEERIVRLGKEDNFWEIGTGPCGPCSEVYFDRGPEYGCGKPDCKPGCDCDRYMEFWNFVFTQFDRQEDGSYVPLAHPNIDTGMGLERMACIMQGVDSIYNIDTMHEILQEVCKLSGVKYQDGAAPTDVSLRIITDHVRTVSFMIGDGILPSNEGRGYILRRLLRRAARHGRLLGIKGAFINDVAEKVFEQYGEAYPELIERKDYIRKIISIEEEKFDQTVESGMSVLEGYMAEAKSAGKTQLSGEQVFKLYDTYGFPIELTQEIAEEQGYTVDEEGFRAHMQAQKDQARAARKAEDNEGWLDESVMFKDYPATEFTGYDSLAMDAKVLGLVRGMNALKSAGEGEEVRIVLDRTPFYAEGGGQVVVHHAVGLLDALAVALAGDGVGAQAGAGALDDVGHVDAQRGGRPVQERERQVVVAGLAGDVFLFADTALLGHFRGGQPDNFAQLVDTGRHGHDFQIEFFQLLHGSFRPFDGDDDIKNIVPKIDSSLRRASFLKPAVPLKLRPGAPLIGL